MCVRACLLFQQLGSELALPTGMPHALPGPSLKATQRLKGKTNSQWLLLNEREKKTRPGAGTEWIYNRAKALPGGAEERKCGTVSRCARLVQLKGDNASRQLT